MFKKTALAAGIGLALSATAQADYRFEADAGISGGDISSITLGGTAYLMPVDDTKGPLGEAAFIDQASSLSVFYADGETDVDSANDIDADVGGDVDSYRLDLDHLWIFENGGGLKLHGAYGVTDIDDDEEFSDNDDVDVYELDATWYICKNFGIGAGYSNTEDAGEELEQYIAYAEYFITDSVSVGLAYTEAEVEDTDFETDSYVFQVSARF